MNFGRELLTDSGIYRAGLTINRFDPAQQAAGAGVTHCPDQGVWYCGTERGNPYCCSYPSC